MSTQGTGDVVVIKDLVKTFNKGKVQAVKGISFSVPRGQRLVLMGLSGSGKSTTLRMLNALNTPTSGTVEVLGQEPAKLKGKDLRHFRRRVAFIFQHFNLVGRLSAIENVLSGALGAVRGPRYGLMAYPDEMRQEAMAHLERVGLAEKAFQRANTLSGGQQQRVGIARALMQKPDLVLADEPVASLDPESSMQVMTLLKELTEEENLTVVCSLHQVELAIGWADRMIGLRGGQIVLDQDARSLSPEEASVIYTSVDPELQ
ncbi:phosphonate ABC transporter ATP-binding protein [Salana multivorans]